ncbi:MAG: DedA family protein [Spirochaetota bacterium]|nr:DedA family protein [Spirochaetota bacterium]
MEDLINSIIEYFLNNNNSIIIYIFLFISAVIENLFPPIPGDTITALGAFLVGIGRLDYFFVYLSTTLGSIVGFMGLFFLGKLLGKEFLQNKNYKYFTIKNIESTEKWLLKYGYWIVLANRFLPGIRSVISITSGFSRLNTLKVTILATISASIWNLILIHIGFLLGDNWITVKNQINSILRQYNITVGILLVIIIAIIVIYKKIVKRKLKKEH